MTIEEWLINNNSFYHLTQSSNIPSILSAGLQRRNPLGICVIRSNHPSILEYLIQMMLYTTNEETFSIIQISPAAHSLQPAEISNDNVVEATNPLHNYIRRNTLWIQPADIIGEHTIVPGSIIDYTAFAQNLINQGLIQELT